MPWQERMQQLEREVECARREADLSRAMAKNASDRMERLSRMLHTHFAVLSDGCEEPAAPDHDD